MKFGMVLTGRIRGVNLMGECVKRLLLGGTHAGEVVSVDQNREHLYMISTVRFPSSYSLAEERACNINMPPRELYKGVTLRSSKYEIQVFVLDGLDPIEELLSGYRPIAKEAPHD
jgi:hypothetical protein